MSIVQIDVEDDLVETIESAPKRLGAVEWNNFLRILKDRFAEEDLKNYGKALHLLAPDRQAEILAELKAVLQ